VCVCVCVCVCVFVCVRVCKFSTVSKLFVRSPHCFPHYITNACTWKLLTTTPIALLTLCCHIISLRNVSAYFTKTTLMRFKHQLTARVFLQQHTQVLNCPTVTPPPLPSHTASSSYAALSCKCMHAGEYAW